MYQEVEEKQVTKNLQHPLQNIIPDETTMTTTETGVIVKNKKVKPQIIDCQLDRSQYAQNQQPVTATSIRARNRRYRKLLQLRKQGFFDEEAIKLRHPLLYFVYVGQYEYSNEISQSKMEQQIQSNTTSNKAQSSTQANHYLSEFLTKNMINMEYKGLLQKCLSAQNEQVLQMQNQLNEAQIQQIQRIYNPSTSSQRNNKYANQSNDEGTGGGCQYNLNMIIKMNNNKIDEEMNQDQDQEEEYWQSQKYKKQCYKNNGLDDDDAEEDQKIMNFLNQQQQHQQNYIKNVSAYSNTINNTQGIQKYLHRHRHHQNPHNYDRQNIKKHQEKEKKNSNNDCTTPNNNHNNHNSNNHQQQQLLFQNYKPHKLSLQELSIQQQHLIQHCEQLFLQRKLPDCKKDKERGINYQQIQDSSEYDDLQEEDRDRQDLYFTIEDIQQQQSSESSSESKQQKQQQQKLIDQYYTGIQDY